MFRRVYLVTAMLVALSLLLSCAPKAAPDAVVQPAPAAQPTMAPGDADAVNWKAYEGTTIRVMMNQHPIADVINKMMPEFEALTGIKVAMETFPEQQFREKLKIELLAGNKDLDVFFSNLSQEGKQYAEANFYADLQPFLNDKSLTADDFGWPDDFPAECAVGTLYNGEQLIIPFDRSLPPIVYYRKDLFEQYGIPIPKDLADLEAAAKTIYEKSGGEIYGIANRGKGATATSYIQKIMHEYGAAWNDETGRPTFDTPEMLAAFEWWGRTLREYGPPGSTTYDWYEVVNEFQQGKVGVSIEGALNAGVLEDPTKSTVVGKVGYLKMLHAPGVTDSVWQNPPPAPPRLTGLAVSNLSQKKEAAWFFVQFFTGKEAGLHYLLTGKQSARHSAWADERFLSTTNKEWAQAMMDGADIYYATPCFAPCSIKDQTQARDIMGKAIVASILGEDVKAALAEAQANLVALWEKEQAAAK